MKTWNFIIALLFTTALCPLSATAEESQKVVLVLGSGGSRGLAHVGVIEELENLGIVPNVIVGCSSGAIVGALYAQHRDIGKVKEILIDLKYDDLVEFSFFEKYAISSREKLVKFLEKHLLVQNFSELQIPFIAVATDLHKGEPVYFQEGELHSAVLSSAALPALFAPYQIEETLYVDGGVTDPLPVPFAIKLGKGIVIASDISSSLDGLEVKNLPQLVRKSFEVMYQRLAHFSRKKADILLEMDFKNICSPIDDDANVEIYEIGKESVRSKAEEIKKKVSK